MRGEMHGGMRDGKLPRCLWLRTKSKGLLGEIKYINPDSVVRFFSLCISLSLSLPMSFCFWG